MTVRNLWKLLAVMWLLGNASAADIVQKGKAINIAVTGVSDAIKDGVDGIYPISDDGLLAMPVVGKISVAGMSGKGLETTLKIAFGNKENYQHAEFQVLTGNVCGWPVNAVTVGGQVKKPGPISFTEGMTIWQAIQAAGGKDQYADLRQVKLFRDGKRQSINLNDLKSRELPLRLNDTIDVAASPINDSTIPWRSP